MNLTTAAQIDQLIAEHTADVHHSLPRILVSASTSSDLLYLAVGGTSQLPADPSHNGGPALKPDDMFMMASCTKLVTTVAVLQLIERGLLTLDTDARALMPELKAAKRLASFDANDEPVLVDNHAPITVRQLLTHTSVSSIAPPVRLGYSLARPLTPVLPSAGFHVRVGVAGRDANQIHEEGRD